MSCKALAEQFECRRKWLMNSFIMDLNCIHFGSGLNAVAIWCSPALGGIGARGARFRLPGCRVTLYFNLHPDRIDR
jgi:hypothetical protein